MHGSHPRSFYGLDGDNGTANDLAAIQGGVGLISLFKVVPTGNGLRDTDLPTGRQRQQLRQVGADGYQLLEWVKTADTSLGLSDLPALEALRRIWLQQYYCCTVPGRETLRWRTGDEQRLDELADAGQIRVHVCLQ